VAFRNEPFITYDSLEDQEMTELQTGDIIVRPNVNLIPGTCRVPVGFSFGHAALVIKGASGGTEAETLEGVMIFESQAKNVPGPEQLRLVRAFNPDEPLPSVYTGFHPAGCGNFFRLRYPMSPEEKQKLADWILKKDRDLSSYRAKKDFDAETGAGHQPEYWYCSLLIWQAYYEVLGIDLDANGGIYVYPNDLICSPYFNGMAGNENRRIRF
jgi:hypothetical protein